MVLRFVKEKVSEAPIVNAEPNDFCSLFATHPTLLHGNYLTELKKRLMTEPFSDVTDKAVADENATLFIHDDMAEPFILECVIPQLGVYALAWKFADYQKRAAVKFCQAAGVDKAYIFCLADHRTSVLHFIETDGKLIAVPVLFTPDFAIYQNSVECRNYSYLRDYLPQHSGDLLSKKSHRAAGTVPVSEFTRSGIDNGDML